MTALVTGGHGFTGGHLVERLRGEGVAALAPTRAELDLADLTAVRRTVAAAEPTTVFHLAAFSSPRDSWSRPHEALVGNVEMTLNVLEAVRSEAPGAVVVLVGSGQVYGEADALPVTEDAPLRPRNPYAVSKAAGDLLGGQYADAHGMAVVRVRPFNHAGPGQSQEYVLSTLARQVAAAEREGARRAVLRTGDTTTARDFTDVRDVARAYELAATAPPAAYNVCSGVSRPIAELIELLAGAAGVAVDSELDPARLREGEARELRGSFERLRAATGWEPQIPLERTVVDALDWWRRRLR